jgi:hypothetical protein
MRFRIGFVTVLAALLGCTDAESPPTKSSPSDDARAGSTNSTATKSDSKKSIAREPSKESPRESVGEPEDVLRRFLVALLRQYEAGIRATTLANSEAAVLWQGSRDFAGERAEAIKSAASISFHRLKVGDEVQIPGGRTLRLDEDCVNEDRQQIACSDFPLPFILVKETDGWRVDASPFIGARKAAATAMRKNANPVSMPSWSADAALLDKLDREVTLTGWKLRPPTEYKFVDQSTPPNKAFIWAGPVQKDETFATMVILIVPAGPAERTAELESLLKDSMTGIETRRDAWTSFPPENGRIGELEFIRARWSGVCKTGKQQLIGKQMHGVIYVGRDSDTLIEIMVEDVEPYHEKSLPIGEAAAWTLRKSDGN